MNRTRLLADAIALLTLLMLITAEVLNYVVDPESLLDNLILGLTFVVGFGSVGWVLARRLPTNPIGWCFALAAFLFALASLSHGWAQLSLERSAEPGLLVRVSALLDTYNWVIAVPLALLIPLLLMPDGRLPSRRWRPLLYAELTGCAMGVLGFFTVPGPIDEVAYPRLDNPLGVTRWGDGLGVLRVVGVTTLTVGVIAGAVAIVVRFRRSRGIERQQLRWISFGACCAAIGMAFGAAGGLILPEGVTVLAGVGFIAIPVCVGVAVLRYRLYDLGRLVSRGVSYAVLTAMLAGIYLALVTAASRVLPAESPLAVAASTLAAAGLFQPLRRRVQSAVDSRFNRARYDADRTVEAFTRRLRDEVDLDLVRTDLLQVVQGTVQPTSAGLWLRDAPR
jgi:hypothetical protein